MEVGIRVEAMNIQTGETKHCNSSYFTMVAKDETGKPARVPRLILETEKDVFRFYRCVVKMEVDKERDRAIHDLETDSAEQQAYIKQHFDVKISLNSVTGPSCFLPFKCPRYLLSVHSSLPSVLWKNT
jgi:hypothetical protein